MVNAYYISSSAVKNQYYHECVARVYLLIFFTARLVFTKKNLLILFLLYSGELKKANLTLWSFLVRYGSFE